MKSNISDIAQQPLHYITKQTDYRASNDYEFKSETKQEQRERILKIILDNQAQGVRHKYLGLPGKGWIFERMLDLSSEKSTIITGVEKDLKIFHKAQAYMIGHSPCDKSKDVYGNKIEILRSSRAVYICGDVVSLTDELILQQIGDHTKNNENKSGTLIRGLTNNTAIWYDFTSSFNKDTYLAIYNLKNVAVPGAVICLTLMYGRDMYFNGSGEDSRVEIVKRALPGFKLLDSWVYKGFKETQMINICGILKNDD